MKYNLKFISKAQTAIFLLTKFCLFLYFYSIYDFNKLTELLFVQLRLFDDWKEEFWSWANKSRSLAIGVGFAAMSNPAKKIIKIVKLLLNKLTFKI